MIKKSAKSNNIVDFELNARNQPQALSYKD